MELGAASGSIVLSFNPAGVNQAVSSLSGLEGAAAGVGTKTQGMSLKAAAGFGLIGYAAKEGLGAVIGSAASFEKQMNAVQAATGATDAEIATLSTTALRLGQDTQYSATEAGGAIEELAKLGVSVADINNGVADATVNLAAATGESIASSATALGQNMNLFQDDAAKYSSTAKRAAAYTDIMTAAINKSATDLPDLQAGMRNLAPAVQLGAVDSFQDGAAAIAYFSQFGLKGAEIGTSLAAAYTNLANPVSDATAKMNELGISAFDANGNFLPLPDLMDQLATATAGMTEEQKAQSLAMIFGREAADVMAAAMKNGGDPLRAMTKDLDANGQAQEAANARMQGFGGAVEQLKGSLETAAIAIGSKLTPALTVIAGAITAAVNAFFKLPEPIQNAIAAAIAFAAILTGIGAAVAVAGPVLAALGVIVGTVGAPFLLAAAAVAILAAAFGGPIIDAAGELLGYLKRVVETQSTFNAALDKLPASVQPAAEALGRIVDAFADLYRAFQADGLSGLMAAFPGELKQMAQALADIVIDVTVSVGSWLKGVILQDFGGFISDWVTGEGSGKGADLHDVTVNIINWAQGTIASIANFVSGLFSGGGGGHLGGENSAGANYGGGGVTLHGVLVNIGSWAAGTIEDVWKWLQGLVIGADKVGPIGGLGPSTNNAPGSGITLGEVLVNIAGWVNDGIEDVWAWLEDTAIPAMGDAIVQIPAVKVDIQNWAQGTIEPLWDKVKEWVVGGGGSRIGGENSAGAMTGGSEGITLDSVRANISGWMIGDLHLGDLILKISDAVNTFIDQGGPQLSQGFVDTANNLGTEIGTKITTGLVAGITEAFGSSSGGTNSMGGPGERGEGGGALQIHDAVNAFLKGIFDGVKSVVVEQLNKTDWMEGGDVQWGNLVKHIVGKLVEGFTNGPASAAIGEAIDGARQWWSDLMSGISSALGGGSGPVPGGFNGSPGTPSQGGSDPGDVLGSAITNFLKAGVDKVLDIFRNFDLSGIASAAGDLIGRLWETITGAFTNAPPEATAPIVEGVTAPVSDSFATVSSELPGIGTAMGGPAGELLQDAYFGSLGVGFEGGDAVFDGPDPSIVSTPLNDALPSMVDAARFAGGEAGSAGGAAYGTNLGTEFSGAAVIPTDLAAQAFALGIDITGMTTDQIVAAMGTADFTPIGTALNEGIMNVVDAAFANGGPTALGGPGGGQGAASGGSGIGLGIANNLVTDVSDGIDQADFKPVRDAVTTKLAGLFGGVDGAVAGEGDTAGGLLAPLIAQFNAAVPLVTAAMDDVALAVSSGMDTITASLSGTTLAGDGGGTPGSLSPSTSGGGILGSFIAQFTAAVPLITTAMTTVATAVIAGMATITAALSGGGGAGGPTALGGPGGGQGGAGDGGGILGPFIAQFTAAVPLITAAMTSVAAAVTTGMATITAALSGGGSGGGPTAMGGPGGGQGAAGGGGLLAPMIAQFTAAAPLITTAMATIGTAVTTGLTTMQTAIGTFAGQAGLLMTQAGTNMQTAITSKMPAIQTAVTTALTTMQTAIGTFAGQAGALMTQAGTNMQTPITTAMTTIKTIVTTGLTAMQTAIGAFAGQAGALMAQAGTNMQTPITSAMTAIQTTVTTALTTMQTAIGTFAGQAGALMTQAGTNMSTAITTAMTTVTTAVNTATSAMSSDLQGFAGNAATAGSDAGNGFKDGLQGGLDAAVGAAGQAAADVGAALGGGYDAAYAAGANIGLGFALGISSMAGSVAAAADQLSAAAAGATVQYNGIESPSKLYRKYGQFIGQGFGLGMTDTSSLAADAAGRLSSAAEDVFANMRSPRSARTSRIPGVAGAGGGGGSSTVNHGDTYHLSINGTDAGGSSDPRINDAIHTLVDLMGHSVRNSYADLGV